MKRGILKFYPIYKEKVWGGRLMEKFLNKKLPPSRPIGESWELVDHGQDNSVVSEGEYKDKSLRELIELYHSEIYGIQDCSRYQERFPLLIKFLHSNDDLSIQVHPDDKLASELGENDYGKTECWYVIHAEENARIIKGFSRDITPQEFKELLNKKRVEEVMNYIYPKKDDMIFLPATTIHALCKGLIVAEIQQSSDITYRVYDYNRLGLDGKPRPLHIEKALKVLNWNKNQENIQSPTKISDSPFTEELVNCSFFKVLRILIKGSYNFKTHDKCCILIILEGAGDIRVESTSYKVHTGDTILVPAICKEYSIEGNLKLLQTFLGN